MSRSIHYKQKLSTESRGKAAQFKTPLVGDQTAAAHDFKSGVHVMQF